MDYTESSGDVFKDIDAENPFATIKSLEDKLTQAHKDIGRLRGLLNDIAFDFNPDITLGPPCGPQMLKRIIEAFAETAQYEATPSSDEQQFKPSSDEQGATK